MTEGKKEAEVLKECLKVLLDMHVYHWRQNTGSFRTQSGGYFRSSMPGVSDILGIMPDGRFLAVECKREHGGVVSPDQQNFLSHISKNHGIAIVCNDAEKLREIIKQEIKNGEGKNKEIKRLRKELEDFE